MAGTLGDKWSLHVLGMLPDYKADKAYDLHRLTYSEKETPLMMQRVLEYILDPNMTQITISREDV
jgi:hypothetical protein